METREEREEQGEETSKQLVREDKTLGEESMSYVGMQDAHPYLDVQCL